MALPALFKALEAPRYRRYFVGQAISILGTWVQTVAMSWLVYRLTGSAALLGLTAFLAQAPQLVISPLAGAFIDRFDKRRMFLGVQALMIAQALILAAVTALDVIQTWHLIVLAGLFGLVNSMDVPLRQSMLGGLVDDRALLRNAVALNASLFNSARFVGPPLAGLILSATSEALCFALNGASFLGVAVAVYFLPPQPGLGGQANLRQTLAEGVRFALSSPPIRVLLTGIAGLNVTGSSFMVLMPAVAKDTFGGDAQTLGWLLGATGGGALLGTFLVASRKEIPHLVRLIVFGWASAGLNLAILAWTDLFWQALGASFLIGMGITSVNVSTNAVLQSISPDHIRGRVISYFTGFRFGMDALGGLAAGTLATWIGLGPTLGGEAALVAVGFVWMLSRASHLHGAR